LTLEEVSALIGVTRERVRQIESRAVRRVRASGGLLLRLEPDSARTRTREELAAGLFAERARGLRRGAG
jgi:hypothetical protein